MIRILLADDQALLRSTFRMLIDSCDDMTVVAEAANGEEAAELTQAHRPDLVLMDIRMPLLDGLVATQRICATPELAHTRVLILTTFETDEYVARALEAGASGFLGKDVTADALLAGIRTVVGGEALLSPAATRALIDRYLSGTGTTGKSPTGSLGSLTDRERELTALAAHGLSNQEIAERLFVSPLTVRTHIHRAMMKVGARDRAQLIVAAYQQGLVRVR
ncbi:two component transcriptional regulator, LuxR family [Promicromonospora umidemergens]|uniref:Response regulator transcription factor n=1 Tax=Promicromonospora umidemergens TaxID=629679 RepID=A0ABP8YCW3_9MICO|nr:response regulator transcription factor [Promicromonospora umidemergens]MCP2286742.1 two component transcriptional regulator, LuxR family [Promicromonospora umidemergens]